MNVYEILSESVTEQDKDTHCSDKCCGAEVKREDCKCSADCKHCNCNDPKVNEASSLDSYYQLTKAKRLAKADGHDYDKLPEYHRGADQPHKEKYKALAKEVKEAKGLGKRVKVVKGHFAGEEGTIREIKHGAFKGAPKSYYIDLDNGEMADNLPADVLRLIKRTDEKEKMLTLKDIDNGGKKDVKLTFKRKPDGTPIDKKQPQKEVKEVSDFKKRELEYELRHEEPKRDPNKRIPYRTPQEKVQDAKNRYSKAVGVMKGKTVK